jgi:hypothetical protein
VAPITASQVFAETAGDAGAATGARSLMVAEAVLMVGWSAVMGVSSGLAEEACIRWLISIIG